MTWRCPYCSHIQIASDGNSHNGFLSLYVGDSNKLGQFGLEYRALACLNPECRQVSLGVSLRQRLGTGQGWKPGKVISDYVLLPESRARPFPDYIPAPLLQDYIEACRIKTLSPKASATLARRCLQGIIRDFCGISRGTLDAEIKALEEALSKGHAPQGVTHESVEAIDHVRKIGNIGAHMEKDINLIIDIDEGEAQALIELIEALFEEWYVEREKRAARFAKVRKIRESKDKQKQITDKPDASNESG